MTDLFASHGADLTSPGFRHYTVTPANADLSPRPRALFVKADGDLVIRDEGGVDETYPVTAGMILPFRAVQVRSGTTATVIAWY